MPAPVRQGVAVHPQIELVQKKAATKRAHREMNLDARLGTTTVVITHNAGIADMADRVIHLSDGAISSVDVNRVRKPAAELSW